MVDEEGKNFLFTFGYVHGFDSRDRLLRVSHLFFALRESSRQLETSLQTILTLQVETIGENYSSDTYSELEAELAASEVLAELASYEQIAYDEKVIAAEELLLSYKESISYADLICYFYFENSGYLMCTMASGEDVSDLAPDYVTEQLGQFASMETGSSEKYLGVDGDGTYYVVCVVKLN
ncbi:MAG: hypothetical protein LUF30_07455 [Lachnospiraceae bacterium]|nr:hypothetical protein [Lachnospiraceae bacterium]